MEGVRDVTDDRSKNKCTLLSESDSDSINQVLVVIVITIYAR